VEIAGVREMLRYRSWSDGHRASDTERHDEIEHENRPKHKAVLGFLLDIVGRRFILPLSPPFKGYLDIPDVVPYPW
jgi:hypothetical protein